MTSQQGETVTAAEILELKELIAGAIDKDPLMAFFSLWEVLEPGKQSDVQYEDPNGEHEFDSDLIVAGSCMPDTWSVALELLQAGRQTDAAIAVDGRYARLPFEMDAYEGGTISGMIPMPSRAIIYSENDAYDEFLEVLGYENNANDYAYTPERKKQGPWYVPGMLCRSMEASGDPNWQMIATYIGFLFHDTGNEILDCEYETQNEIAQHYWERHDFTIALAIVDDADDVDKEIERAQKLLKEDPFYLATLKATVAYIYEREASQETNQDAVFKQLRWPHRDDNGYGISPHQLKLL